MMNRDHTHCSVRQSFIAAFSSRHLNTMKKPDSLQQWLKAEEEKHVQHRRKTINYSNQDGRQPGIKENNCVAFKRK